MNCRKFPGQFIMTDEPKLKINTIKPLEIETHEVKEPIFNLYYY